MGKKNKRRRQTNPTASEPAFSGVSKEWVYCLCLFVLALGVRLLYQAESNVNNPLRADAGKYFSAAFNLSRHGVYSIDPPSAELPKTRTDLSAGYPLFLALVMKSTDTIPGFYAWVRGLQAVMGAFVVVLTFLLARQSLGLKWAAFASLLTALSPHLIAMDDYILTESFFIFVLVLGTWLLALAWQKGRYELSFLAGFALAFSGRIRVVALALPFAMLWVFFLAPNKRVWAKRTVWVKMIGVFVLGVFCVMGLHRAFTRITVTDKPATQESQKKYTEIQTPASYLKKTFRPPMFAVRGESHVLVEHGDQEWKKPTTEGFWDSPGAYLRWNLWQRFLVMWSFHNAYTGDVYFYPMIRKGFHENGLLILVHRIMLLMHWPLYFLCLAGIVLLMIHTMRGRFAPTQRPILLSLIGFKYQILVLAFLGRWMPRYGIPARPFSYILAAAALWWIWSAYKSPRPVLEALWDGEGGAPEGRQT